MEVKIDRRRVALPEANEEALAEESRAKVFEIIHHLVNRHRARPSVYQEDEEDEETSAALAVHTFSQRREGLPRGGRSVTKWQ